MVAKKSDTKSSTAEERPKVFFYPEPRLLKRLDKSRARQEASEPFQRSLSRSSYICSILDQFDEAKREYDQHHDGGWTGFWALVRAAVTKKGKRS